MKSITIPVLALVVLCLIIESVVTVCSIFERIEDEK